MGEHSLKTDLWNGLRGKCPACGRGHMFRAFLKVAIILECQICTTITPEADLVAQIPAGSLQLNPGYELHLRI